MYNILVVDDSALMRKLMCDIINTNKGFQAKDICPDGASALKKLTSTHYDAVTLNMFIPRENGIETLKQIKAAGVNVPVIAISTSVKEDREMTINALENGAVEVVLRPYRLMGADKDTFSVNLSHSLLAAVSGEKSKMDFAHVAPVEHKPDATHAHTPVPSVKKSGKYGLVALASSTGGPQALHTMIPMLPAHIGVPFVIVQHMPYGFTASLADRINAKSKLLVKEAEPDEVLKPDTVYIAPGGRHLEIVEKQGRLTARVFDDPPVMNLRPCADIMYESLNKVSEKNILCVVLTGMGADGSKGINSLKKHGKNLYVITQSADTCVVYGMPKATDNLGLSNESVPITGIANSIAKELGG